MRWELILTSSLEFPCLRIQKTTTKVENLQQFIMIVERKFDKWIILSCYPVSLDYRQL
ncbi:MAG: hypothetical protein LBO73_02685 [Holosporaceae bacterium]|nr:hypothetical protein [Holosporaceae bacterium]